MSNYRNNELERFAEIFKALSNPNRLKIFLNLISCCAPGTVGTLEDGGSACVGQLAEDVDIVPSTVSHHIKELHRVGLIRTRRSGQRVECWIDPDILQDLAAFFATGKGP
jgi:ArsR family transcriptional regulator